MRRIDRRPYWITARHAGSRYAGTCSTCKQSLPKGARALYYPQERVLECATCGRKAAALMAEEATGSPC